MEILLPFGGLSDELGADKQKLATTRIGKNVRGVDPVSGADLMAQRSGQVKHSSTAIVVATKVAHLCDLVYDNPVNTYANLASASCTVEWSKTTPNTSDSLNCTSDSLGNYYVLDGATGVVKYNSDGRQLWKISLPALAQGSLVRALAIDDAQRVFVGVSTGGDMGQAKLFCYEQLEDNKTSLLWTETPGWFTECLKVVGTTLYAAQNDPIRLRSRMALYTGIGIPTPDLTKEWPIPYPVNDFDSSPKDGAIATAHEPNANRGQAAQSPDTTGTSEDWTPQNNLSNYSRRAWAWLSSADIDGDGTNNSAHEDGEEVAVWIDKTGNDRSMARRLGDTGPILRKAAVANRDTCFFNGTSCSMESELGTSTFKQQKSVNRTLIPNYGGAQFALIAVVRSPHEAAERTLIGQAKTTTANVLDRLLMLNGYYDASGGDDIGLYAGNVFLQEHSPTTSGASGRQTATPLAQPLPGATDADGLTLITWVFDHGIDDVAGTPTRSVFRVNGRPIDRWHSGTGFESLERTTLGCFTVAAALTGLRFFGDVLEVFVLSDYNDSGSSGTSAPSAQRLVEMPTYPDVVWSASGNTELEKLEGWLAHRCGFAHKLPSGLFAAVESSGTPADGATITIGSVTYTWKDTLVPATANQVQRVAAGSHQAFDNLYNLLSAVNGSGVAGTAYSAATVAHPDVWCTGVVESGNVTGRPMATFQTRDARISTAIACSDTSTVLIWLTGTSAASVSVGNWTSAGNHLTQVSGSPFASYTWANGDFAVVTAGTGVTLGVKQVSAKDSSTSIALTESIAGGNLANNDIVAIVYHPGFVSTWSGISPVDGSGRNNGHYPHTFFLYRSYASAGVPYSYGGPPRADGTLSASIPAALLSVYGMVAKWDPSNGKPKNVLTSNGPGFSGQGIGGVGWGVRYLSDGSMVCCGPRQAVVTSPSISADAIDIRKVVDLGDSVGFVTTPGATAILAWQSAPGALTYHYPRMAVDKWDNAYVPIFQSATGTTLIVYAKLGTGSVNFDDKILELTTVTDDPRSYAVALDLIYPDFPAAYSKPRAERLVLATERAGTSYLAVYNLRIVSSTLSNTAPRTIERLAACGQGLYKVVKNAGATLIDAAAFAANARFIDSATMMGMRVFADGQDYRVYDPHLGTFGYLRPRSGGKIPPRGKLLCRYKNRLFIARFADAPHVLAASKAGDLYGWDFDPPGDSPIPIAAYRSDLTTTGDFPDVPTGLAPYKDDLLYIGGDKSIHILRGDPMQGGQFDLAVAGIGMAFGRAHCFTPDGSLWWVTNEAELYSWSPGSGLSLVSKRIQRRLAAALDFSVARPELVYNPVDRCVHLFQFPHGAGGTLFTHYALSMETGALWEDTFAHVDIQPTAAHIIDGDDPADRVFALGSRDGYVREWSKTASDDDGYRIDSDLLIGPLMKQADGMEGKFTNLEIILSRNQGGAAYSFVASWEPDDLRDAIAGGPLMPGRNTPSPRVSGSWVGLRITGSMALARWAIQRATLSARAVGPQRARGR